MLNGVPDVHHDFDAANQVVGWGYDAAGNVLSDTSRSYPDDVLNRLTGLSEGSRQHAYAYNGDGLVISQKSMAWPRSSRRTWPRPRVRCCRRRPAAPQPGYLYGMDRLAGVSGGARTWYGTDGQGSVRYLLDDGGYTRTPRSLRSV